MTTVEPLSLKSLPRVSRASVTRLPWTWTSVAGTRATVVLAGVGPVHLSWDGFAQAASASREEFALVGRDGRRGRIAVDRWFALTIVATTLGWRAPRILRGLGRVERGVLGGQLAASLVGCGCTAMVSLDDPGLVPERGLVSLMLRAQTGAMDGCVLLDLPAEWLSSARELSPPPSPSPSPAMREVLGRLRIPVSVELAMTTIQASEWVAARCGDAVVFAGCRFLTTAERPVSLRVGDHAADAIIDPLGAVVLAAPFSPAPPRAPPAKEPSRMSLPMQEAKSEAKSKEENLKVIGAAPIEVVAEVGRLSLRGDELLGLQRGSVLALGHQGQMVSLIVGGQPWARGELVNVDGELGVRITDLVRA